jgi:hypothetical protein
MIYPFKYGGFFNETGQRVDIFITFQFIYSLMVDSNSDEPKSYAKIRTAVIIFIVAIVVFTIIYANNTMLLKNSVQDKTQIGLYGSILGPKEAAISTSYNITIKYINNFDIPIEFNMEVFENNVLIKTEHVNMLSKQEKKYFYFLTQKIEKYYTYKVKIYDQDNFLSWNTYIYATITSIDLRNKYEENTLNADNIYKGKTIYVEGIISDIDEDIWGTPYVKLNDGTIFGGITCDFPDSKSDLLNLRKGDRVIIKGICKGELISAIWMDKCILVSINNLREAKLVISEASYDLNLEIVTLSIFNQGNTKAIDVRIEIRHEGISHIGDIEYGSIKYMSYPAYWIKNIPIEDSIAMWWYYNDENNDLIMVEPKLYFFTIK